MSIQHLIPTFEALWFDMCVMNLHYSLGIEKQRFLHKVLSHYLPRNAMIVELGVCNGSTGFMLASIAQAIQGSYQGIDNWSLEGSRQEVIDTWAKHGLKDDGYLTTLVEGLSHDPELVEPFDFLLIDAGHDEENVSKDVRLWLSKAGENAIVAFDDYPSKPVEYHDPNDPHWAVRYYADIDTSDWELLGFWQGLMVRRNS